MKMVIVVVMMVVVVSQVSGFNLEETNLLCSVLRAGERVLNSTAVNDKLKKDIKDTLYGTNDGVHFDKKGKVTIRGRCFTQGLRSPLCTYRRNLGCFAASVVGTFTCICTPGTAVRGGKLCGESDWNGQTWSGNTVRLAETTTLFQDVWEKIIKRCLAGKDNMQNDKDELETLQDAVRRVRDNLHEAGGFFYLGGNEGGGCIVNNRFPQGICAAYEKRQNRDKNNVTIPWADKIQKAVENAKRALQQPASQTIYSNTDPTTVSQETTIPAKVIERTIESGANEQLSASEKQSLQDSPTSSEALQNPSAEGREHIPHQPLTEEKTLTRRKRDAAITNPENIQSDEQRTQDAHTDKEKKNDEFIFSPLTSGSKIINMECLLLPALF
ncbi:Variant surface glycoprotein [Trypanosoma congolense IL3000]|uniref:Variant surface glycoprotein n=1 Tax=Trypanosoma congolense (strain IL3000) TaxID=1068625 RepID=F9WG71_TRYCI|nr:Variant surface glycoprotein [Trypanosoma congolense IL3000]